MLASSDSILGSEAQQPNDLFLTNKDASHGIHVYQCQVLLQYSVATEWACIWHTKNHPCSHAHLGLDVM